MALHASCLGLRGKTSGVENGLHGTANFSISQPITIPSQSYWTENAARISSVWTPYHFPYSSETVWEGDSMAMGSSQLSSAAQNYSQLLSQHHTAHAWPLGVDRQISQHWPQNELSSSLSGSEDSYFNQFPNATTACSSYDDDQWKCILQSREDFPLLQQQGLPEQGLQTTAPDDVEAILRGPDIDTVINAESTSYVEGSTFLFAHDQRAWNVDRQIDQHWPQNELSSSPSGSEDSYSNQFPNATTTCGSYDDDEWEGISQIIEDFQLLQQQGIPEQGLQTTALDDVEAILRGSDIDTIINAVSTSNVEDPTFLFAHDQSAWNDVSYGSSCWPNTHSCSPRLPVNKPTINIITQAPKVHRARYEREAESGAKGLLKTESKEPMAIQVENVTKGTGDITLTISAVIAKEAKHPYVYTSCLGRGMPASWKQDAKKRTVTIVLREKEGFDLSISLSFLAIKRNRMENIDLTFHKKDELCYFQIKFETAVPSAFGDIIPITAISQSVRILCPSTATRRRRESEEGRSR